MAAVADTTLANNEQRLGRISSSASDSPDAPPPSLTSLQHVHSSSSDSSTEDGAQRSHMALLCSNAVKVGYQMAKVVSQVRI
jgi:hypothetical protein